MKVMAIVKATADSEAGRLPDPALFDASTMNWRTPACCWPAKA
jgi:hypothetical protein